MAFSPDGKILATASQDSTVKLWSVVTGRILEVLEHPASAYAVAFSPDGTLLATGAGDGHVRLSALHVPVPADFNADRAVDFSDFLLFAENFGKSGMPIYDLDGSGAVDFGDFLLFAKAFG